jgi:hypothetical protein
VVTNLQEKKKNNEHGLELSSAQHGVSTVCCKRRTDILFQAARALCRGLLWRHLLRAHAATCFVIDNSYFVYVFMIVHHVCNVECGFFFFLFRRFVPTPSAFIKLASYRNHLIPTMDYMDMEMKKIYSDL